MKKLIFIWIILPLYAYASEEHPMYGVASGLAHMIQGKSHVYYGPEEEEILNKLPMGIKQAANKKGFKAIRFNGHVIIHSPLGYFNAWMLYDSIENCNTNEYLTAKLLGHSDDEIRTYYGHLKHTVSDFRKDKKEAMEWISRWKLNS